MVLKHAENSPLLNPTSYRVGAGVMCFSTSIQETQQETEAEKGWELLYSSPKNRTDKSKRESLVLGKSAVRNSKWAFFFAGENKKCSIEAVQS